MFRRSRFSVRPNVGTAGRTAAAAQEAPPVSQEGRDAASNRDAAEADKSVTPSENPTTQGDGSDQTEGNASSAAVQRRKRFSVKPKVIPGRPSAVARTTRSPVKAAKSPVKASDETPVEVPEKADEGPEAASQTAASPRRLQSPRRRRPSEDSQQPKVQPEPVSSDSSAAAAEDSQKQSHQSGDASQQLETPSDCQDKESHFKVPDKVPPSLPSKEATEISERAKTLASTKTSHSTSAAALSLSRLLNDPSDLHRLAKARKLRELLREEVRKERKLKKSKLQPKEFTLDPAKMTMRDLIHYLPESNPMTSSLEVTAPEDETVVPPLSEIEDPPERAQEPTGSQREEEEEEEAAAEGDQEEALLVPQVKVAEDGTLIIDESSLTVEVQRAKGPNLIQERDPIFERGSTTTYSSFRKGCYTKPWSAEETDMFFLAVSMVGTDFTMICQLFPHRARSEIKNKFKKEERQNSWRIDKAFRERRKLDIEYFSKLLQMILEVQKSRKKLRSVAEKKGPAKKRRRTNGKKAQQKQSDEEEDEIPDLEGDEEQENDAPFDESQAPVSKTKKQRKRRRGQDTTTDAADEERREPREDGEQDKVGIPEGAEVSHLQDDVNPARPAIHPAASGDAAVVPDKPPPGRAARPRPRKSVKRPPPPAACKKDTCDEADVAGTDGGTAEQANSDTHVPQRKKTKVSDKDDSSDENEVKGQPLKPTRYGRMPKSTNPSSYPSSEDRHSSPSEATPTSPTGPSAPRPKSKGPAKKKGRTPPAQEPKRPKLITLRASQSEYSDDEDENQEWAGAEQRLGCSSAAFVPASLCSLHPVTVEVEETMEELDILASMPDVLGISQDALGSDVKTVEIEPYSAQLDLQGDVIDCLPSEYTVSEEESYNEAAHTLLTISNLPAVKDQAEAGGVNERNPETDTASASVSENRDVSVQGSTGLSGSVTNTEPHSSPSDNGGTAPASSTLPQLGSSPEKQEGTTSQTRRSRISKIKPNPVLRTQRPVRSQSQPQTSKGSVEMDAAPPSSDTEVPPAAEVNKAEPSRECLPHEIREEKGPEAAADSQENPASRLEPVTTDEVLMAGKTCETTDLAPDEPGSELNTVKDQTRRSRSQKAKPTLPVASRRTHSMSQPTQDSKPTPDPPQEAAEVDISSPAKSQDLGFNSEPSEDVSTAEEKKSDTELTVQLHSGRAASGEVASGDKQEATAEISSTSESAEGHKVEPSLGPAAIPGPASVQEGSDRPASCDTNTGEAAFCHTEETEAPPTQPVRKTRFQKVKPKPNLASASRSMRSTPKSTNNSVNASPNPPVAPQRHEERVGEVPEPPGISSPLRGGDGAGPGSAGSGLTATGDLVMAEAQHTGAGDKGETESSGQCTSDVLVQPEEEAPKATAPTPESEPQSQMLVSTPQVESGSAVNSPPAPESRHPPPDQDLPVSQGEAPPTSQTRKGRRVNPKPNLPQTQRTTQRKPLSTEEPVTATPVEPPPSPWPPSGVSASHCPSLIPTTAQPCSAEAAVTDSGGSEPQRNRRFPKARPSLGSSAPSNHPGDSETLPQAPQRDGQPSAQTSADGHSSEVATSDGISMETVAEKEWVRLDPTARASNDGADISEVPSSGSIGAETGMEPVSEEEGRSRDGGASEAAHRHPVSQRAPGDQPESATSAKSSRNVPARRSRLVKPKPNLGRTGRSKQTPSTSQTGGDCGGSDAQRSPVQPGGGAVEQQTAPTAAARHEVVAQLDQPPQDPAQGCLTGGTGYAQDLTTSGAVGNQIQADFNLFSEMLSGQVPSDPDEPFFILSLTEIPACSLGEMVDSSTETLPLLPVTQVSQQQQQRDSDGLEETLSRVVSTEESGLVTVGDVPPPPAYKVSDLENPADPDVSAPLDPPASPRTEHRPPEPRQRRGRSAAAAKQPRRKKSGRNASEAPAPPPEPGGSLLNTTDVHPTPAGAASASAAPTKTGEDTELISDTEVDQDSSGAAVSRVCPAPSHQCVHVSVSQEDDRTQRSSPLDEEPPTGVSQYFLSDIFTEVEDG